MIVEFAGVEKRYGDVVALGGVDLSIPEAAGRIAITSRAELTPELEPAAFQARLDWSGLHWPVLASVPEFASAGDGYRFHTTGLTHDERGYLTKDPQKVGRLNAHLAHKILQHQDEIHATRADRQAGAVRGPGGQEPLHPGARAGRG